MVSFTTFSDPLSTALRLLPRRGLHGCGAADFYRLVEMQRRASGPGAAALSFLHLFVDAAASLSRPIAWGPSVPEILFTWGKGTTRRETT
jgi:hypothetical protein